MEERRHHIRFPVIHNVGEPVELKVFKNGQKISIPGYILNLSASGVGIVTLGKQSQDLEIGARFILDLKLPNLTSDHVEGTIVRIEKSRKAQLHHSNDEWFLSLQFTKIKPGHTQHINKMAEDWSICETKVQMRLPDICFKACAYWDLCEKPPKLKS